ncbi:MAG: UbiA family prenyltransferase [Acidiferrobacteraceae bacterium]
MTPAQRLPVKQVWHDPLPLCVDLDGTLLRTDSLIEALLMLLKANPLILFLLPVWLIRGKAYFKQQVGARVTLAPATLPYNLELLKYLTEEEAAGRRLVLATAADRRTAEQIAGYLGIFSRVIASDGRHNLSGRAKARRLAECFGEHGFDYAGNSHADLAVWPEAAHAIVVSAPPTVARKAASLAPVAEVFPAPGTNRWRAFLKAIRIHQWAKNLLILVPLATSHSLASGAAVKLDLFAFIAFSLCSSSVYLLNDLLDLEADRLHRTKCRRPFASGDLPLTLGLGFIPLLLLSAGTIAITLLPRAFALTLAGYFLLTLAYSFYLKRIALLDVLVLALLYSARIGAGAVAIHVPLSHWLLAFSMFLFLSLALVKRFSELRELRIAAKPGARGRGYLASDLEQLASLGAASGYISVLVLALYANSAQVTLLYRHPFILWLICPLILYWISRIWLLAHRGQMHEDPILFALRDRVSYILAVASGFFMWLAS